MYPTLLQMFAGILKLPGGNTPAVYTGLAAASGTVVPPDPQGFSDYAGAWAAQMNNLMQGYNAYEQVGNYLVQGYAPADVSTMLNKPYPSGQGNYLNDANGTLITVDQITQFQSMLTQYGVPMAASPPAPHPHRHG
jgi:hypothetical protein